MQKDTIRKALLIILVTFFAIPLLRAQQTQLNNDFTLALQNQETKGNSVQHPLLQEIIELDIRSAGIEEALIAIAEEMDLKLMYSKEVLPEEPRVTLSGKRMTLHDALWEILEETGMQFAISPNRQLVVLKMPEANDKPAVEGLQQTITGKVIDAQTGEALPGVNILVKETSSGTATDVKGDFELTVESLQDTLVFSFIGYQTQEVALNGRTEMEIFLKPQAISGEELVVVGYGTQKSDDVTGSVSRVTADQISNASVTNFQQSLKGKISGVRVTQNTGSPSAGVTIKIRGFNSITAGSQPLYVIDGHPVSGGGAGTGTVPGGANPLSNINPYDIESIDILKDASAAAIYGSQGANGVVIVTTKSGSQGDTRFQFNMSTGWQSVTKKLERLTPEEYAEHFIESRENGWIRSGGDPNAPYDERGSFYIPDIYLNPSEWNPTNWQDEIFRTGAIQKYNLSASGGSENIRYAISGGYSENLGVIIETSMKNYTFRSNIDADISEKIKVGLRFNPSYSVHEQQNTEGHFVQTTVGSALVASPLFGPYTENGEYTNLLAMRNPAGIGAVAPADNPVAKAKEDQYQLERARILGNMFLEYELLDQLNFRSSLSVDGIFNRTNTFLSSKTSRRAQAPPNNPEGNASSAQILNWLNENSFTYQESFNDRHNFTALLGASFQENDTKNIALSGDQFPGDKVPYLSAAGNILSGTANRYQWSLISFYSRVNYDYDSRYLLTATIRRDGSSRFGQENKYGTFPSLALGWRMSEEEFMEGIDVISNLKWRLSYGVSGNNSIPNYAHIPRVTNANYVLSPNQNTVNAVYATELANSSLTWETNRAYNAGLDLELFDGRIEFITDAYYSITDGLLLNVNIPAVTGFTSVLDNVGEVQNKGLEFALNTINSTGNLFWTSSFNISFNRNKVTALSGAAGDFIEGGAGEGARQSRTVVGKPLGLLYARVTDGIFNNWEEINNHVPQDNNPQPGDRRFKDVNGDGRVDNNDRAFVGDPNPDFTFGFSNDFSYKGFNLSVLIDGSYGNDIWHNYAVGTNLNGNANQDAWVYRNRWKSPDQPGQGNIPKPIVGYSTLTDVDSDFYVHDGSYVRLSNVTLSYNIPPSVTGRIGLRNAQINISGQNLYTLTTYPGYDPEIGSSGSNPLSYGSDTNGIYPLARIFTTGISLQF